MVRGDKASDREVGNAGADEGEEIDRIMKEIEDLEKKMDTVPEAEQAKANVVAAPEATASSDTEDFETTSASQLMGETSSKVVPMRPLLSESMAETDAVPARDEPLVKDEPGSASDGGLSLKIGGCTEVNLEFTRSGMSVSLSCNDEGLSITTDQGAEFRIPFKRSA